MPRFCASCGAQMADTASVCPACGKGAAQPTGGGAAAAPAAAPAPSSGLADNVAGLLCYSPVGLIADIVFLVTDPYKSNKFVRFHSFQSLFLAGAWFVIFIGMSIVSAIATTIIGPLALLLVPVEMLLGLAFLVLFVVMMIKAYGNNMTQLPIIGPMAAKQAGV